MMKRDRIPKLLRTEALLKAGVSQTELESLVRKLKQARGEVSLSVQQLTVAQQRLEHGGSSEEWIRDLGLVFYAMAQHGRTKNAIRGYIERHLNGALGIEMSAASSAVSVDTVEPQSLSRRGLALEKRRAGLVKARAARSEKRRLAQLQSGAPHV